MPSTRVKSEDDERGETENGFNLNDKVEYDDFVKENIPEDIIFPEELNRFLRDQIRELRSENGTLRRSLDESEEKLSNLSIKTDNSRTDVNQSILQPVQGLLSKSSEIAASKIIELSKKCRDQNSEIEVLKSRCKKLESKLSEKTKIEESKSSSVDSGDGFHLRPFTIEDELKNREDEIKLLRDKLNQANSRLYESKNAFTTQRKEFNKAQKLLCREVGENVSIASLLSSNKTGWKGRAEQIQNLQNKLSEYEGNSNKLGSSGITFLEKRNITNLRNIEKDRRKKSEDSSKELGKITIDLEIYKRKYDACKARIKILENDLNSSKQSIAILNEKRSHDDQLVQALNGQVKAVEDKFREREREMTKIKERKENEFAKIFTELNRLKAINENQRKTIDERETEIDSLRNGVCEMENKKINDSLLSGGKKNLENCSNGPDYNEYVTLGIAAEAERERLMELVIVLNRRLDEERFASDKMGETLRCERMRLAKIETKLQKIEMERVGITKINNLYNKKRFSKSIIPSSSGSGIEEKYETRFRIEFLEEESLALKTRLATVERDKISDLAMYKQMLYQARKTFQDAYRGKSTSSSYSTVTI